MQREETLDLGHEKKLYYTSNSVNSDTVVVIVHGLTSYIHQSLYEDARRFFNSKGLDVCRPELYSWKKGARSLRECTLNIHGEDLNMLIRALSKHYKKIFMIGHSYGAPSIACVDEPVMAVCNWDGTYMGMNLSFFSDMKYIGSDDIYVDLQGSGFLIGRQMYDEAYSLKKNSNWLGKNTSPVHFIYAGSGIIYQHATAQVKRYAAKKLPCTSEVIKGADHNFNGDDVQDKLFNATYNYLINVRNI